MACISGIVPENPGRSAGLHTRIAPNFRDAQFSRISVFEKFAETIFADQGFRVI